MNEKWLMFSIVMSCTLVVAGCDNAAQRGKRMLLAARAENARADFLFDLEEFPEQAYGGIPAIEKDIIATGSDARPVARELLMDFDHRLRCSGLTIMMEVGDPEEVKRILVEHLVDPYEPIRWKCWHKLEELGLVGLDSMPRHDDSLQQWKDLRDQCLVTPKQ